MSVALQFKLTQTGQAAVWNANNTGTSLNLTHIQFGSGNRAPSGTETALLSPQQAVAIAAGFSVSSTQIRMSAIFTGNQNYVIREVGLWAGDPAVAGSKLVGYWSQAAGDLAMKSPGVDFIFSHDMTLDAAVPAGSLTILADNAQSAMLAMIAAHEAKADPHPQYTTNAEVNALIEARVGDYVTSTNVGNAYTVALDPAVTSYTAKTAFAFKAAAANTGAVTINAGGGAVALLRDDGTAMQAGDIGAGAVVSVVYDTTNGAFRATDVVPSQINAAIAAYAPSKTGAGASGTWSIGITGNAATATNAINAGSVPWSGVSGKPANFVYNDGGLYGMFAYPRRADGAAMAFSFAGQSGQPTYLWGVSDPAGQNSVVYNPANFSVNYAASAGNADTVDGMHASAFARLSDMGASLGVNGYQRLPNGLILQWGSAYVGDSGGDFFGSWLYPIAFPNACLQSFVSLYSLNGGAFDCSAAVTAERTNGLDYTVQEWSGQLQSIFAKFLVVGC